MQQAAACRHDRCHGRPCPRLVIASAAGARAGHAGAMPGSRSRGRLTGCGSRNQDGKPGLSGSHAGVIIFRDTRGAPGCQVKIIFRSSIDGCKLFFMFPEESHGARLQGRGRRCPP